VRFFDRLDRYTLRLFIGPLLISLAVLLIAQLLERLLRLFDLVASAGASLSAVFVMVANLVPYYLGLSLPMAFTAAIFMAAARMCDDSELDVMLASGRSITRIAAPYFVLAILLSLFNFYLFGSLQPLTRYGYHVAVYDTMQTGWDARIEPDVFVDSGQGFIFSADQVDQADGRNVKGVFMEKRRDDGSEDVTTSISGVFVPGPLPEGGLQLKLEDAVILRDRPRAPGDDSGVQTLRFAHGFADHDFAPAPSPYRDRGESVSELTLPELWLRMRKDGQATPPTPAGGTAPQGAAGTGGINGVDGLGGGPGIIDRRTAASEFHVRLARALILPLLPLLALPLGMASKRGRKAPGVVFATLVLLALNHALQFGASLATRGHVSAVVAVWTPFVLFALLSLWIFRDSLAWPGDNVVSRVVIGIERLFEGIRPRVRTKGAS
jgi:lipopolysaccharide export system permease protein